MLMLELIEVGIQVYVSPKVMDQGNLLSITQRNALDELLSFGLIDDPEWESDWDNGHFWEDQDGHEHWMEEGWYYTAIGHKYREAQRKDCE